MKIQLSKCCKASIKLVGGMPDFPGDTYSSTMSYECTKCGKPCDIIFEKEVKIVRDKCELFSKMYNKKTACMFPKKECGFQFYNSYGGTMGLCRHNVEKFGFKKCWEDMVVLIRWKKANIVG